MIGRVMARYPSKRELGMIMRDNNRHPIKFRMENKLLRDFLNQYNCIIKADGIIEFKS